jgi:Ca2+-binding RTX toxin-like protein
MEKVDLLAVPGAALLEPDAGLNGLTFSRKQGRAMLIRGTRGANQLVGTRYADTILADDGNDTIDGGAGADIIDGGAGVDTVTYASSPHAVRVDLSRTVQQGGDAEGDQLYSVENVVGSASNDTLAGNSAANALYGGNGHDSLFGGFDGQIDVLDGGKGIDSVDYSSASRGMTIVLNQGTIDGSATLNAADISGTFMGQNYTFHLPPCRKTCCAASKTQPALHRLITSPAIVRATAWMVARAKM